MKKYTKIAKSKGGLWVKADFSVDELGIHHMSSEILFSKDDGRNWFPVQNPNLLRGFLMEYENPEIIQLEE